MLQESLQDGILLTLLVSGLPLMIGAGAGLVISVVQAATQIQEQSLSFLIKYLAVALCLGLCGTWFSTSIVMYFQQCVADLSRLGAMP